MLPTGQKIKVKSGTQIIDRFWRHLRSHLQYTARAPGNPIMTRKTRAAQWSYWPRGENLWNSTGRTLALLGNL